MSLTKEAIEKIQESSIKPEERIVESEGRLFSFDNNGSRSEIKRRVVEVFATNTLTSIVEYIKDIDYKDERLYLHIEDPWTVTLFSSLKDDNTHDLLIQAKPIIPSFEYNRFMSAETLIIQIQSKFLPSDDKDILLKFLGNIKDENVKNTGDDGVSQQMTVKSGVTTLAEVKVPNPVVLTPFRTFHEVPQPASTFIFRMHKSNDEATGALFEADGQSWKLDAIQNIKEFLSVSLAEVKQKIVILA
ncbi:MAG: hypothetical protein LBV19_06185 [Streptococcaceae bacterium]|jgi:hypothetical protein|nr:hypothetical protein [Streptococcaceae bacterium]